MAGETAVEAPATDDNTKKIEEPVKSDKEAIVEEEKAATEEKKDEEKAAEAAGDKKEDAAKGAKKAGSHQKDPEEDMVYLFQFQRSPCIPSISPFCLKLESWLKLHGIKYTNVDHKCKFRSKKGMLPFIEINGEEIADSNLIIEHLATKFSKAMPAVLSPEQRNVQHAMVAMVENHLHWTMVHWRSKESDNILKGYKLDIQTMIGSKAPPSILNWVFKYMHCRKVGHPLHLLLITSSPPPHHLLTTPSSSPPHHLLINPSSPHHENKNKILFVNLTNHLFLNLFSPPHHFYTRNNSSKKKNMCGF